MVFAAVPQEHDLHKEGQDLRHHTMTLLRHAHDHSNSQTWFRLPVYPKLGLKSLGYTKKSKPLVVTRVLKPGEEIEEAVAVVVGVVVAQW